MTNIHPKPTEFTEDQIRAYLADRYGVELECVKTCAEAGEGVAGYMSEDDPDSWLVCGEMPDTDQTDWFFAGCVGDIVRDMRAEQG